MLVCDRMQILVFCIKVRQIHYTPIQPPDHHTLTLSLSTGHSTSCIGTECWYWMYFLTCRIMRSSSSSANVYLFLQQLAFTPYLRIFKNYLPNILNLAQFKQQRHIIRQVAALANEDAVVKTFQSCKIQYYKLLWRFFGVL